MEHGQPMFMPDAHPEAINSENPAAFRTPDGKIHVGAWHPDAYSAATAAYGADQLGKWYKQHGDNWMTRGFQQNNGNFVTPEQATDIALKRKQITMSDVRKMMDNKAQIGVEGRGLESLAFREAQRGQHMPEINVGLERAGQENLKPEDVVGALSGAGIRVTNASHWHPEGGEPTMVASLHRPMTQDEGKAVAEALGQQAIPQHHLGKGEMFVPHPEKLSNPDWANFNPDFFLNHNGYSLTENAAKANQGRVGASGVWDRMTVDPNFSGGNLEEIAKELGVPDHERFYRQSPANRQKITDYFKDKGQAQYMPDIPSDDRLREALSSDKIGKIGAARNLPAGTPVSLRIDIPAYNKTGDYAVTIHDRNIGKALGYDGIAKVDNPTFYVQEKGAQKVRDGMAKYPMAAVNGDFDPSRSLPKDLEDYTQVGFNPKKHSYFYDKQTMEPVISGDKAISAGNTVYVKNPVYGNPAGFKYMPDSPDAIDRAALRRKSDGEIITGDQNDTHFMIPNTTKGVDDYLGMNGHNLYDEGFVDKNREVVRPRAGA